MKIKSITLQKIAAVCGGLGLFFGLGFAGNFETTGETSTGTFMVSLGRRGRERKAYHKRF